MRLLKSKRAEKKNAVRKSASNTGGSGIVPGDSRGIVGAVSHLINRVSMFVSKVVRAFVFGVVVAVFAYGVWFVYSGKLYNTYELVSGKLMAAVEQKIKDFNLKLDHVQIEGIKYTKESDIYNIARVSAGVSMFAIDAHGIRKRVESLPWVRVAMVSKQMPNRLFIKVLEYAPFALWLNPSSARPEVISKDGHRITVINDMNSFSDLPIVYGKNANQHAREIIEAVQSHKVLRDKIKEFKFIDERRWDVKFGKVTVKLPEIGFEKALSELLVINKKREVEKMRVVAIDMRFSDRVLFHLEKGVSAKIFQSKGVRI